MRRAAAVVVCRAGWGPCSDAAAAVPQVIDDPQSDSLLLVMEHVQGGSLEQRLLAPRPAGALVAAPGAGHPQGRQ